MKNNIVEVNVPILLYLKVCSDLKLVLNGESLKLGNEVYKTELSGNYFIKLNRIKDEE